MRVILPAALLIFQLLAIGYARAVPTRYFCWAPFDIQTLYHATAVVNGHELTPAEFVKRYHRPIRGTDNRSPQHVIDMIEGAEKLHPYDQTQIEFNYKINGGETQQWRWPQPVVAKAIIVDDVLDGRAGGGGRRGGRRGGGGGAGGARPQSLSGDASSSDDQ